MRFSLQRKLFLFFSIVLFAIFVWSSSWESLAMDIHAESFNNRKSLSLQSSQEQGEKSPDRNRWRQLISIFEKAAAGIGQEIDVSGNSRTENLKRDDFSADKNVITQRKRMGRGHQRRLILVSYMRAGSTFTGDLFQFSPNVMYFYEPLLYTNDVDVLPKGISVRNRLLGQFMNHPNPPETQVLLESLLRCNFTTYNIQFVLGLSYSQSFKDYIQCMDHNLGKSTIEECLANVTQKCHDSSHVMAKVLRLKMWEIDELLSRDPLLKVIHLVRDPRGIINSRRVAGYYLELDALCTRMTADAELSLTLQKRYPGRLLTLRYEDLAMHPQVITKNIYDFAGIDWTDEIGGRIQNITSPKDSEFQEKIFETKRKNSTATAFNWRLKLDFGTVFRSQRYCAKMMDIYGYKQFQTDSKMKDLKVESMAQKYNRFLLKAEIGLA